MPKITDIREQKRKSRFNVYVDGNFTIGLSVETLVEAGLRIGQEISEQEIEKLRNQDIKDKLYNQTLRFLSYRPRSEREVRDHLDKKISAKKISGNQFSISDNQGVSRIVEPVISKLKSLKLIDDREFTRWWIEQRQSFRPKGIYALKQELKQKGISEKAMAQWLNGSMAKEIELEGAKTLVHKKLRRLNRPISREGRMKFYAFLQRRGFSYDTIKLVLDEVSLKK